MFPVLYESSWVVIPTWHVIVGFAVIAAYFYAHHLRENFYPSFPEELLFKSFCVSYVSGYFGARALTILVEEKPTHLFEFLESLFSFGGLTFFGGLLASLLGNLFLFRQQLQLGKVLSDLAIPSVLLGLSIGRLGCFLNGDDYGLPASHFSSEPFPWWSVTFSNHENPLPRVPVQLLESFLVFLVVLFLYQRQKKKRKLPGYLGLLGIFLYSLIRFFLEFLRGDPRGFYFEGLFSTSQLIALGLLVSTLLLKTGFPCSLKKTGV